jgi:hypothetical protein
MAISDIYPMPNGTIWGFDSLIDYTVSVEPLLFIGLLVAIWVVVLVATLRNGFTRSFTFASLIVSILSIPITLMGWLANKWMYLAFVLVGVGLVLIIIEDSYY